MSNYPGFFIVFEGGDGAGKSTQVRAALPPSADWAGTVRRARRRRRQGCRT